MVPFMWPSKTWILLSRKCVRWPFRSSSIYCFWWKKNKTKQKIWINRYGLLSSKCECVSENKYGFYPHHGRKRNGSINNAIKILAHIIHRTTCSLNKLLLLPPKTAKAVKSHADMPYGQKCGLNEKFYSNSTVYTIKYWPTKTK